jgi:hypothetical protein
MPFLISVALELEIMTLAWIDNASVQFPLYIYATKGRIGQITGSLRFSDQHHAEAEDGIGDERVDALGQTTSRAAIGLEGIPSSTADYFDALYV